MRVEYVSENEMEVWSLGLGGEVVGDFEKNITPLKANISVED